MAISPPSSRRSPARRPLLWGLLAALVVLALAFVAALVEWSGASLNGDPAALARLKAQPLAGSIESARAFGPSGRPIPLAVHDGRLTPDTKLAPGERVSVDVVVKRPSWLAWALGKQRRETLILRAPVAHVSERWLTVPAGSAVKVGFDQPVSSVVVNGRKSSLNLGVRQPAGSVTVAAAARPWERLGHPVQVSWFPAAHTPVAISNPAPGTQISPSTPLRLTFSKPVSDALGSALPKLTPAVPGHWRKADSHTLVFQPSGFGAPFGAKLRVDLPKAVEVRGPAGEGGRAMRRIDWSVPAGSTLRLQQLLSQAGYLPLSWTPAGSDVARTPAAEVSAATSAPQGQFGWTYGNTPSELHRLWIEGQPNQITRGALMMFQDEHNLTVDGFAGPRVWKALLADAIAGKRRSAGYSYVYVHRNVPQLLTLWHNGHTVLTSPGNTGVPSAPTKLGTFQVFEHIKSGTMSGTNPDGSHYNDPGIKWISYFNGGDALHAFTRASFGTPQSLGCVELPLASAAKVWPYTPIGTLVTIEN
jgi:peptidoglycan hydrolase-like protein with peptidoglycan-binding domain